MADFKNLSKINDHSKKCQSFCETGINGQEVKCRMGVGPRYVVSSDIKLVQNFFNALLLANIEYMKKI